MRIIVSTIKHLRQEYDKKLNDVKKIVVEGSKHYLFDRKSVYYYCELRWTSSDYTLKEPDASDSFFCVKIFPFEQFLLLAMYNYVSEFIKGGKAVVKVLFVCHGNICRSVMAQFMFEKMLKDEDLDSFAYVDSGAVTTEEIGNDMYYAAKDILDKHHVPYEKHRARQVSKQDIDDFDLIICMDSSNLNGLYRKFGNNAKIGMLLDTDVSDPWWTRDFEKAYADINKGLINLKNRLKKEGLLNE